MNKAQKVIEVCNEATDPFAAHQANHAKVRAQYNPQEKEQRDKLEKDYERVRADQDKVRSKYPIVVDGKKTWKMSDQDKSKWHELDDQASKIHDQIMAIHNKAAQRIKK